MEESKYFIAKQSPLIRNHVMVCYSSDFWSGLVWSGLVWSSLVCCWENWGGKRTARWGARGRQEYQSWKVCEFFCFSEKAEICWESHRWRQTWWRLCGNAVIGILAEPAWISGLCKGIQRDQRVRKQKDWTIGLVVCFPANVLSTLGGDVGSGEKSLKWHTLFERCRSLAERKSFSEGGTPHHWQWKRKADKPFIKKQEERQKEAPGLLPGCSWISHIGLWWVSLFQDEGAVGRWGGQM